MQSDNIARIVLLRITILENDTQPHVTQRYFIGRKLFSNPPNNQLFNLSASRRNRFETAYSRTSKLQLFEFQKLNKPLSSPTIFSSRPFDSRTPLLSEGVGKNVHLRHSFGRSSEVEHGQNGRTECCGEDSRNSLLPKE